MLSKNDVKYIQSLCHKKQRDKENVFVAEGTKLAEEIFNSNYTIVKGYATQNWLLQNNCPFKNIVAITDAELEKISQLPSPNKIILIVQKKQPIAPNITNPITLVLDGIQDPGNFGTIIRIADWFGITDIVCSIDTADVYNPKVIQSTMGSFARTNIFYTDLEPFFNKNKLPVLGAVLNGTNVYTNKKTNQCLLLIGNEGKGIRNNIEKYITHPITIPKIGHAESLNAAVATGIILSHII